MIASTAEAAQIRVSSGQSIQAAIDSAAPGDTIVIRPGSYTENIDVNKLVKIRSQSGKPSNTIIIAEQAENPVFNVVANNVEISGLQIRDATGSDGVRLDGVTGCKISKNDLTNNNYGIYLTESDKNTIYSNKANSNGMDGILATSNSDNNKIHNNIANSNANNGIKVEGSTGNTVKSNTAKSNTQEGIKLTDGANNNVVNSNTVLNNLDGIMMEAASNDNMVKSNVANSNKFSGIGLDNSNDNNILGNVATKNNYGIRLTNSPNNTLSKNMLRGNLILDILIETT